MDIKIFYENNPKIIYTKSQIQQFNNIYIQNYTQVSDFNELLSKFPFNLHPIIVHEFHKQYDAQKGIQGGILIELTIFATLAKILNIDNFSFQNGQYVYENNEYCLILQGNKGHGANTNIVGNDIIIFEKSTGKSYNCEVKEPFARLGEMDWQYNEDGHLCATPQADKNKIKLYQPIADAYNKYMNVFEHIGHNFPLTSTMVQEIIENYFNHVDYIITYDEKDFYLLVIPHNATLFLQIYDSKGSEIRGTNGKNLRKIFTKNYATQILTKYLIKEEDGYYYFYVKDFLDTNARQSSGSRYKLREGFAIKSNDAIIENGILKCKKNAFKQNCAVISPKIHLISNYSQIKRIIIEGDY